MKPLFARNIDTRGRLIRGVCALVLLAGSAAVFTASPVLGVVFLVVGSFVAFEALRGWCGLRACGIKTRF